jgi:hypothetical protein
VHCLPILTFYKTLQESHHLIADASSWKQRPGKLIPETELRLYWRLKKLFENSRRSLGSQEMMKKLREEGFDIGRYRVRNLMRPGGYAGHPRFCGFSHEAFPLSHLTVSLQGDGRSQVILAGHSRHLGRPPSSGTSE